MNFYYMFAVLISTPMIPVERMTLSTVAEK
jgi:hypothetical protein